MRKGLWSLICLSLFSLPLLAKPVVIAHRGASGYLPEHTLEAVTLAYAMGADYIEQDLVLSKDDQLMVLHDIHLDTVTDVAEKFPGRQRSDGRYYAIDFTLAELKTLTVSERRNDKGEQVFANRYRGHAQFQIPTFEEEIELIQQLNRELGKQVGFYPEIKSPAWHRQQGKDISQLVLAMLRKHGLDNEDKAIYVQCFDFTELKRFRQQLGARVKLIQLIGENSWGESGDDHVRLRSVVGLEEIAQFAQGIGPWLPQLVDMQTLKPTELATWAHDLGLKIHPYTFRLEQLPKGVSAEQSLDLLFKQVKIDGLFTDFTDVVVNYLRQQPEN